MRRGLRAAWRLAARWWPAGYLALFGVVIAATWLGRAQSRWQVTIAWAIAATWFLTWRGAVRAARRWKAAAETAEKRAADAQKAAGHVINGWLN